MRCPANLAFLLLLLSRAVVSKNKTSKYTAAQQELSKAFEHLGKPCNYEKWNALMPDFWEALFQGTSSDHQARVFQLQFAEVHVDFPKNVDEVQITRYADRMHATNSKLMTYVVNKENQTREEQERCASGAPLVCDQGSSRCACMDNPKWLQTQRVEMKSGRPELNGTACFSKPNTRCIKELYGYGKQKFPCVDYGLCDPVPGKCVVNRGSTHSLGWSMVLPGIILLVATQLLMNGLTLQL